MTDPHDDKLYDETGGQPPINTDVTRILERAVGGDDVAIMNYFRWSTASCERWRTSAWEPNGPITR